MKLSIIIPALNEEKYLPFLLKEIRKQNFKENYEIVVADGGSNDRTIEMAKKFGCIVTKGGLPAKSRNEGAKIAKGEIFLFLDADNIYLPYNFLENILRAFEKRNLGAASFPIMPDGNKFDKIVYKIYNWGVRLFQNFFAFATNGILVKKEVFEKIRGFDEEIKIGEDHDFVKRAAKITKFGFIKTQPLITSARRFEKDGRIKTYFKYILAGLYIMFLGPVKSDIFKYKFNHLNEKKKQLKITSFLSLKR